MFNIMELETVSNLNSPSTGVADLEVLSRYLSEDELKEVAKEVARESFRKSMGTGNSHSKENIEYYAKWGAYEAVKQFAEENDKIDLKEVSETLNKKVNSLIKGLQLYQLKYDGIIKESVEKRREDIQRRVDDVLNGFLQDEETYSGIYKKLEGDLGYMIAEHLMEHFRKSFNTESK